MVLDNVRQEAESFGPLHPRAASPSGKAAAGENPHFIFTAHSLLMIQRVYNITASTSAPEVHG
jgi:hypothetical protein